MPDFDLPTTVENRHDAVTGVINEGKGAPPAGTDFHARLHNEANDAINQLGEAIRQVTNDRDWAGGENFSVYPANNPGSSHGFLGVGSEADPYDTYEPAFKMARVIAIDEADFPGDGASGLATLHVESKAVAGSQGQAVGAFFGATTKSSYVGEHSQADAVALYAVGRAATGSSRTGIGLFVAGRREAEGGRATGIELSVDNQPLVDGSYNPVGYSNTTGIWMHATGNADAGCGIQFGHELPLAFKVGIGFNAESIADSSLRDDSEAERSIDIRGKHVYAIKIAEKAGEVDLGKNALTNPPSALGAPYRLLGAPMSGNANTSAASGNKYFLVPGLTNAKEVNPQSTAAANQPYRVPIVAADLAGIGTTKLRLRAALTTAATAPGVTIEVGLYKISGAPTQTLGELVTGSTIKIEGAAKESNLSYASADFDVPPDGTYAVGYTVSGAPSGGFALEATPYFHHV